MKKSGAANAQNRETSLFDLNYKSVASYLKDNKKKIEAAWEEKVRSEVISAKAQTSLELLNSLGIFLDELVRVLEDTSLIPSGSLPHQGMSKLHGGQRAQFTGYNLPQLLKEFSILRIVLTEDLYKADLLNFTTHSVIDCFIDSAISLAASEFVSIHQAKVEKALQVAEASNMDLEHFAAVAAHDLKSPLATISSYLDLLAKVSKEHLGKKSIDYIELMQRTSERMRNLVDQLLEFARLTRSDKSFHVINTNDLLNTVLENLQGVIKSTKAEITCDRLQSVNGESTFITQLFQNLIANSIKFRGERPPSIHISSSYKDGAILFTVKDKGIGFESKYKKDIFVLYKKLRKESGSGIGLATCRKIVELHGGAIWAESNPGEGAAFSFTLPAAYPQGIKPVH